MAAIVESKSLSVNRENGFPPPQFSFNLNVVFGGRAKGKAIATSVQPF